MKQQPRIIFFGTPFFALKPFEALIKNFSVVAAVTNPDERAGRSQAITPPPIKVFAEKYRIAILQPRKLPDIADTLRNFHADAFVVAAYGKIIPKEILDIPRYGSLNIHPSLLPRWRGASPVQYTLLNGDIETGVTVMLMDEKMDHGPILANAKFKIQNAKLTTPELSEILSNMGAELVTDTIPKWIHGEITPTPQNESGATYSTILKKEDGRIDWSKSAVDIERRVRAFDPWPGSFTFWAIGDKKILVKVCESALVHETGSLWGDSRFQNGRVFIHDDGRMFVKTGDGILEILRLQPEGRKNMSIKEFLNGYKEVSGAIFG